jgi:hypothetical protein
MTDRLKRALAVLGAVFVVYGVLVATHEGEFWPFSIYPMFSQAGNPWNRALVREVGPDEVARWDTLTWATLPGTSYGTKVEGHIDAIDVANYVGKTQTWTPERAASLGPMLLPHGRDARLVVLRASGRIVRGPERDSVAVTFVPYVYLDRDTTILNPALL